MINLIFTPVDESLPELVEFDSSYAGSWNSDWVYIITKRGEIESARLSVSGNRPKPVGQDILEGGKWESCLSDYYTHHRMVKYGPVIGWAYKSDIRELAAARKQGANHD